MRGTVDRKSQNCRKKTITFYVFLCVQISFPVLIFCCLSFSLVLQVFIVITITAPLESSTFFSSGAINEEGLTPFFLLTLYFLIHSSGLCLTLSLPPTTFYFPLSFILILSVSLNFSPHFEYFYIPSFLGFFNKTNISCFVFICRLWQGSCSSLYSKKAEVAVLLLCCYPTTAIFTSPGVYCSDRNKEWWALCLYQQQLV